MCVVLAQCVERFRTTRHVVSCVINQPLGPAADQGLLVASRTSLDVEREVLQLQLRLPTIRPAASFLALRPQLVDPLSCVAQCVQSTLTSDLFYECVLGGVSQVDALRRHPDWCLPAVRRARPYVFVFPQRFKWLVPPRAEMET